MDNRKKNILIGVLIIGILSMTVAYATLSQQLTINGTAKVQARSDSWNIHFAHITNTANEVVTNGYSSALSNSITLSENDTTATLPEVTLRAPGDSVDFYFDVINEGDITGYINAISNFNVGTVTFNANETLSTADRNTIKNALGITLSYTNGNPLNINDSIAKGEKQNLKVTYTLSNALTILPTYDVTFGSITATIDYGQSTVSGGTLTPVNPSAVLPLDIGQEVVFGTEHFHVLWTNSNQTALLSKYNIDKTTNLQSNSTTGNYTKFSQYIYWDTDCWTIYYEEDPSEEEGDCESYFYPNKQYLLSEFAYDVNGNPASYSGNPFPYVYREDVNSIPHMFYKYYINNTLYREFERQITSNTTDYIGYYVNAYKNNLNNLGLNNITARLASYEEMIAVSPGTDYLDGEYLLPLAPTWAQGRYWLGSSDNHYSAGEMRVVYNGFLDDEGVLAWNSMYGIRPVIIIPTSEVPRGN